jgi:L,D-transpeptidase catalytic domain
MRRLVGCVALAGLMMCGPAAAEDAGEAIAAVRAALPPSQVAAPIERKIAALPSAVAALDAGSATVGAPPPPPPPITLVLNADLRAQRVTVIENGKAKYTWPISSGRAGYATQPGTFQPQWASRMHYSRQYEYAPMPHAVFFNRGTAFHATSAVGLLGRPASHGCIRLAPGNAAQLFKLVHQHGYQRTKVVVHGGSKGREPAVARRKTGGRQDTASAKPAQRKSIRVSRYNGR